MSEELFEADAPSKGNARSSGYKRNANDWYVEPPWFVRALLGVETFTGGAWDPCCGIGVIPRVCRAYGIDAVGSDLVGRGYGDTLDFFRAQRRVDAIISNPPFNRLQEFITRALAVARIVAVVAPFKFAEGSTKLALFLNTPLKRVWVSPSRVAMPPGEIAMTGLDAAMPDGALLAELDRRSLQAAAFECFAWYVWQQGYADETMLGWLPVRPTKKSLAASEWLL